MPGFDAVFGMFDEQFSLESLQNELTEKAAKNDSVLDSVRAAVGKAADKSSDGTESRYVVDMDDALKESIQRGEIKLETSSTGEIYAQIRDSKGHYGKKLPIKEELIEEGISTEAAEMALQMDVIRVQLQEIITAVRSIETKVTEVIQGQQNDRLGLFYSGLSLYIEARSVKDETMKKYIMAQALRALSDANSQMIQELRTSMEYLVDEKYKKTKKITDKIEEQLANIRRCYGIAYRASFLKTSIYFELGEIPAMLTALDEYGRFIEALIIPYAGRLSELDRNSQFIERGTWGRISHTLDGCRELKKQIAQNNVYYLAFEEAKDGDRR